MNIYLLLVTTLLVGCSTWSQKPKTPKNIQSKNTIQNLEDQKFMRDLEQLRSARKITQLDAQATPDEKAYELVVRAYRTLSREESKRTADQFLTTYPQSHLADEVYLIRAQLAFEKEDYSAVLADLNHVLQKMPRTNSVPLALRRKALAYQKMNLFDLSQSQVYLLKNRFPNSPEALQSQGLLLELNQRLKRK